MAGRPWKNTGVGQLPGPLHPLSKHPKTWFPKYNSDDGLPEEEYLHNFILAMKFNDAT